MSELFPFQEVGSEFLSARRGALLADEMGLGKTVQALTAAKKAGAEHLLVVCPASACINWQREVERWVGTGRDSMTVQSVSYDKARDPEVKAQLKKFLSARRSVLVLDESHFLKSTTALRSRTVFGKGGLAHKAGAVWCLSGTPTPNHPAELWTTLHVLDPRWADFSYEKFVERYCTYRTHPQYGVQITGSKNLDELRERLDGFMLRRTKAEVLPDLPPIRYANVYLDYEGTLDMLTEIQSFRKDEILEALDNGGEDTHIATLRRLIGLAKIEPVVEMLRTDLDSGMDKVVVFAHHLDVIRGLEDGLAEYRPLVLTGNMLTKTRQWVVDMFQNNPGSRVIILQDDAGRTNLTLTAAHNVVIVEPSWVPDDNLQEAARCHRIGQNDGVLVRFVTLAKTLDEIINHVLRRKTEMLAALYNKKETA